MRFMLCTSVMWEVSTWHELEHKFNGFRLLFAPSCVMWRILWILYVHFTISLRCAMPDDIQMTCCTVLCQILMPICSGAGFIFFWHRRILVYIENMSNYIPSQGQIGSTFSLFFYTLVLEIGSRHNFFLNRFPAFNCSRQYPIPALNKLWFEALLTKIFGSNCWT